MSQHFQPRIDSQFSLSDLATEIIEPKMMSVSKEKKPDYKINFSFLEFGGRKYRVSLMGVVRILRSDDEILGKIPHETVCNLLDGSSDMKLWKLGLKGPGSNLSPDFVDIDKKLFVEVSTSRIGDESSLKDRLKEKLIHYKTVAENNSYQIGVVVVGPDSVLTNLGMSSEMVDALCHRYRSGLGIHSKIEKLEGRSLQFEDESGKIKIVKGIVKVLSDKPISALKSSKHFPVSKIMDFEKPPSALEMKKAARLLRRCRLEAQEKVPGSRDDLDKYLQSYGPECRTDYKRVTNIPMVLPKEVIDPYPNYDLDIDESSMPSWLKQVWKAGEGVSQLVVDAELEKKEALGQVEFEQHRIQRNQCFNAKLSDEDKEEASTTGLWGKSMKMSAKYKDHKSESKKSFHPINTPTDDIESFICGDGLDRLNSNWLPSIPPDIENLMADAKMLWTSDGCLSLDIIREISRTKIISHASLITRLFTEICFCYKYWIKRADFYKKWCGNVQMVIRCVDEHTFVSFAFPKAEFSKWDTKRLGPTLYESKNYIFTDISSFNEPTIEHFVKSGPYLTSTIVHLQSNLEVPIDEITMFGTHVSKTLMGIYLLFLNNKTDSEELMTNQRYLNMGVLEELNPNPYKFVKRLPDMYKSRLTCYLVKRTISEIERFSERTPKKVVVEESGVTTLEIDWLKGLFSGESLSFRQKVNEFYFGYVVSKERGRGADRNFKIMKKIVEQEYKYRDDDHPLFTDGVDAKDNQTHVSMLKTLIYFFKESLKTRYGDSWKELLESNIFERLSSLSFLEVATLKVSSRNYDHDFVMPALESNMTTSEIKEALKAANPEDTKSRPKVMESLTSCVQQYLKEEGKDDVNHIVELVPWALKEIEKRGFFYSDIFPKPQHGGDREIHVLEFKARLIQLYVERISRTICEMTPSDSLTHPNLKENFVKTHYNLADVELPSSRITLGKSADASKWCQRHHSSKFAASLAGVLPRRFIVSILRILWFWTNKVIVFPIQFVANFISNQNVESNKTYKRMQKEFETGTGIFTVAKQNRMTIQSGMMQGILHYTSSFMHAIIQESMKIIQKVYLIKKKIQSTITVIQGSDDSGELISLSGAKPSTLLKLGSIMLHWKERVSRFISIYPSYEKSCIGSADLIEYNSEWSVRKTTYKPTFRWVSACLEVGVVEKFMDRVSNFYNTATTVLEGGGSVLETAVIQLSQAWMHYWMLGLGSHGLSSKVTNLLIQSKDPSLGYFPVDSDFCAGMPGVNFLLYTLYKRTDYGHGIDKGRFPEAEIDVFEEDVKDVTISRDLRKIQLKFGNHKIFEKIVKGMNIPALEILLKDAEENPELIYYPEGNWDDSKTRIYMKIFEPGVKESLSKHSATARILSASAYIISRPCLSTRTNEGSLKKVSLLQALVNSYIESVSKEKIPIESVFVHYKEYEELLSTISQFSEEYTVQKTKLRTRNKHQITIIDREMFDVSIIELCKQVWFPRGGRTGLSSSQVDAKWKQAKELYPFLKNSRTETERFLKMSAVQLRNFLDSLTERPRKITLLDSAAKGGSIRTVLSRVFWPSTKIHLKDEIDSQATVSSIRSEMFSICSHWMPQASKLLAISNLFNRSPILSNNQAPYRLQKLSVMNRSLKGDDKASLISQILKNKIGAVGFFTVSQAGWGWNRKGFGEWKGKMLDTSCVMEFQDSVCTKIIVDKISNATELGHLMSDFIESTCSSFPTTLQDSDHWLSSNGKINGGRGAMIAIPIFIETSLKIRLFDELQDKDWILETSNNIIRLKAVFPRGQLITILSDRFLSYEWDPSYKVDQDLEYSEWNNSEPISISTFQHELSGILNGSKSQCLRDLRSLSKLRSPSGWHLDKLADCLRLFYSIQENKKDVPTQSHVAEHSFNSQDEEWIRNMISGDIDFDWDSLTKFDEDNKKEADTDYDFSLEELDDDFEDTIRLLMEEREPILNNSNKTMPSTNRCFSNIDTLSKAYTNGVGFRQNVLDFKEKSSYNMPGILGKLISLVIGDDRMMRSATEADVKAFEQEEESISLMTSVRTDAKAAALSEDAIAENLNQITTMLSTATGFTRDSLLVTKARLERLLHLKRNPSITTAIGDIKTTDFLLACKQQIAEISPKFRVITTLDNEFYFPLIQSELDKLVMTLTDNASIAPTESSVYRESITKPNLTTLLVDLMSELTNVSFSVGDYSTSLDNNISVDVDL